MYNYEIENKIREENGVLDAKTYFEICDTSPQIRRVERKENSGNVIYTITAVTDETMNLERSKQKFRYFNFKVVKEKPKTLVKRK